MIDLRPYAAKLERPCRVGTKHLQDAFYPYLVQSLYRAGYFTHYAGDGAVRSCKLCYAGEEVDLGTSGYFREGFAFLPMLTLGFRKILTGKGELPTWLKVEKAS